MQGQIRPFRGNFFLKINKRACTSIRHTRVGPNKLPLFSPYSISQFSTLLVYLGLLIYEIGPTHLWNLNKRVYLFIWHLRVLPLTSWLIKSILEIVGEWVMNRRPFWIKIMHISPILLGRFCDKKSWKLLSVLCSLWGIYVWENLQCGFSLQTLQCAMFWFSLKLA